MITLITGGVKSGKSAYALDLLDPDFRKIFIATADPHDESMKERIEKHQEERKELGMETKEAQINIASVLPDEENCSVIIDCVTMWIANLMYMVPLQEMEARIDDLLGKLARTKSNIIIITNEVGLGIIPENKLSRDYAASLATLNKRLAKLSDRVILMVSGIPLIVK